MGRPPKPIDPTESLTSLYGWKIRALREEQGWTQAELDKKIALSGDAVSSLELGKSAPDDRTGELLDETLGMRGYFREHAPLVRKERIPAPARSLAGSEAAARTIRIYEPCLITGLFQTEAYARENTLNGLNADRVDEIVAERLRRQEVLERKNPPRVMLVADEAAFRRQIGGVDVLRSQLDHLIDLASRTNIVIQIVPSSIAAYGGLQSGFAIMSFAEGSDVAYVDAPRGLGQFTDNPAKVVGLMDTYDLIRSAALPAVQSTRMIKQILESL